MIRGPLGAGKSTIADRLARRVGGQHVAIDRLLDEFDLEEWEEGYISERSFLRANRIALERARPLLRDGTPVVFDGNFYWRSVVNDLVRRLRLPHVVFTLRVPLATCVARDRARSTSYGANATREVFAKTTAFDYGVALDASGSIDDVMRVVLRELRTRGLASRPGALRAAGGGSTGAATRPDAGTSRTRSGPALSPRGRAEPIPRSWPRPSPPGRTDPALRKRGRGS